MSWDVILLKLPNKVQSPEQIPEDYVGASIGTRSTVTDAIRRLFRIPKQASGSVITLDRTRYAIEIDLGEDQQCTRLILSVHDDATAATRAIQRLAEHFQMRAIDCRSGEFVDTAGNDAGNDLTSQHSCAAKTESNPIAAADSEQVDASVLAAKLPGVVSPPYTRVIYVELHKGESPKQLQKAVFAFWSSDQNSGVDAFVSGPTVIVTHPDGMVAADIRVDRYRGLLVDTDHYCFEQVELGASRIQVFVTASSRRCAVIRNGITFVRDDSKPYNVADCRSYFLTTDKDFSRRYKTKQSQGNQ